MKRKLLASVVALATCAVATVIGLTLLTAAGTIGIGSDYDMAPKQTQKLIAAAAIKLGGSPGAEPGSYHLPLLPWSSATIKATVTPKAAGSHVELYGHATKLKALKQLLDRQLPPLTQK